MDYRKLNLRTNENKKSKFDWLMFNTFNILSSHASKYFTGVETFDFPTKLKYHYLIAYS